MCLHPLVSSYHDPILLHWRPDPLTPAPPPNLIGLLASTGLQNDCCLLLCPSVQLTQPGLSLCPMFTVTVTRPMEAKTKGGLFLLSCPGSSARLWAQTELKVGGCWRTTGGIYLANLKARAREQQHETMRERG
ncbi:unnamed protein product [Pleuronectes platessa]|uniref:Uncharacterized protein n=1 Tax=Pleuronectes platessa TaxID=8262 RepID=A0A9N7VMU0_PLEPL|nr:unnamed protein product [Pleuronectes platessa]